MVIITPAGYGGKWWPGGLQAVKPSSGMLLPNGVKADLTGYYCRKTSFSVPGKPLVDALENNSGVKKIMLSDLLVDA